MIHAPSPLTIPSALTERRRWVLWNLEQRNGKATKPPFQVSGAYASTTDPSTWTLFPEVVHAYQRGGWAGLGLVVTEEDDLVAIDLDHCVDPDGTIQPWAREILDILDSYAEYSPTDGVHVWCRGSLPDAAPCRKGRIECYRTARYLTVTGRHVPGAPYEVHERTEALARFAERYLRDDPPPAASATVSTGEVWQDLDDDVLLETIRQARNGGDVLRLFQGDTSRYPSHSEADAAFCAHLAFYTNRNEQQMDRIFRRSALMRPKWDERHYADGRTYGQATIQRAIARCSEVYHGNGHHVRCEGQHDEPAGDQVAPPHDENGEKRSDPGEAQASGGSSSATDLLGEGLGQFLSRDYPEPEPLIEGVLSSNGGGWIGGEEKLFKTIWALEEALCLAIGQPVAGRFTVPSRQRVSFIEEEDPPARTQGRLAALLRAHGLDPDDPAIREDLDQWFLVANWTGFTLDDERWIDKLKYTLAVFQPAVVYLDVLRKVTKRNLNKSEDVGPMLDVLDSLRREHGTIFRVIHHNRKVQGTHRAGRGSQELNGSYQLGAWGENSLFFEPIGRKQGVVKIEVQRKDGAPVPPFSIRVESDGPENAVTHLRVIAEELKPTSAAEMRKEQVYEVMAKLPPETATNGKQGVSIKAIAEALECSDKTVRKAVDLLEDEGRCLEIGKLSKGAKLYAVKTP